MFSNINDPKAIATGFSASNTTYVLTWTVDEAPGFPECAAPAQDTISITTLPFESPTIAHAGEDQCIGANVGSTTLNANDIANGADPLGASETGTWSQLSCLLYTSPSPRDLSTSRMPSSA